MIAGNVAAATAAENFAFEKSFGPDGLESSGFAGAGAIAIDHGSSFDFVYVLDQGAGTVSKFDLQGNPVEFDGAAPNLSGNQITGLSVGGNFGERQLAVDASSGTIYVITENGQALQAFQENGEPYIFTAGPGAGSNQLTGFTLLMGVTVDGNGAIYAADWANEKIQIFSSSGLSITDIEFQFSTGPANLAVSTTGTLYVNKYLSNVIKLIPSSFPVTPTTTFSQASKPVNSAQSFSVAVDPATDELYIAEDNPARISLYSPAGELRASFGGAGEPGELDLASGVAAGTQGEAEKVFVSNSPSSGLSQVYVFDRERILDRPTVELLAVDEVSSDSAVLRAKINPNSLDTEYQFEYGLEECEVGSCTAVPVFMEELGSGHEGVVVSQPITGLDSGATYHFRVVAKNELGQTDDPEKTFSTQGESLSFQLEDSRVWEMVSPVNKLGGAVVNSTTGAVQASADGNGLAYLSRGSIVGASSGNRSPEESSVLASRGNGIWRSEDLTPPFSGATEAVDNGEYNLFSPDLSLAEIEPRDDTPLSPWASERTPYLRINSSPPIFQPLVTSVEPFANVPPGTNFGPTSSTAGTPAVKIQAASEDLAHIVLQSRAPLIGAAQVASLYMWSEGLLEPVSKLPEDEGEATVFAMAGSGPGSTRHAVSSDGSRVFWTPTEEYDTGGVDLTALYVRDLEADRSARLDVVQPGVINPGEPRPAFQGASEDGDVVFFTDSRDLTLDSSPTGRDLYRCEILSNESFLGCINLVNLSPPRPGSGESAGVFDQVTALSDDGERLYFVASGVLTEQANAGGAVAVPGQPNLYFWQVGDGLRFVASLSENDYGTWGGAETRVTGYESELTAAASPNGRYLAFTSEKSLTGYENRNAQGELNAEVFIYDSVSGQLQCASCNPSGAAAVGEQVPSQAGLAQTMDPGRLWSGRWAAGLLPEVSITEPVSTGSGRTLYRSRSILDTGRVFFNAVDGLVPADSNGNWDVYQYEPVGTGSCMSSSEGAAVARSGTGCVSLISSGTAAGDSGFLDASSTGDDVFFMTRGRLSPWDEDEAMDVYDARVGGTAATRPPVLECAGESCRSSAQQQAYVTPRSEAFQGTGNLGPRAAKRCPKGKRKVQRNGNTRCVRKHRKHKKQPKRTGMNRRANR